MNSVSNWFHIKVECRFRGVAEVFEERILNLINTNKPVMVSVLVISFIFVIISYYIPKFAYKYANWKLTKKGNDTLKEYKYKLWVPVSMIAMILSILVSVYYLPFWKLIFVLVFTCFAVFGAIVDDTISIIGNEMLLYMLPVGLVYRFIDGGFSLATVGSSLLAVVMVIVFLLVCHLIVYLHKGVRGVGMGDVKLSFIIALTLGVAGMYDFLIALALGLIIHIVYMIIKVPLYIKHVLSTSSTFPMCAAIMFGLWFALIARYIPYIQQYRGIANL